MYSNFFEQKALLSIFQCCKCEFVSIGTLFYTGATLKLGEKGKIRKHSKVPKYFGQACQ